MIAYDVPLAENRPDQEQLITDHLSLVKRIAYHLLARLPARTEIDDLVQAGMLGLLEAANKYDPTLGASFATFAGIRIRGAMLDEVRRHDWTPRSVNQKRRRISEAISTIEGETGGPATAREIAAQLEITVDEYHDILRDTAGCRLYSLEDQMDESTQTRQIAATDCAMPDEAFSDGQFREELNNALRSIPDKEQMVLSLYYERELNLKEIGEVLGVSESRVCQIHGQAIARLRTRIEN